MKKTLLILGILTLMTVISLGTKTGCRAGWDEVLDGDYIGYNKCVTNAGERYELCFKVYDSANTENYWCEKGKVKEIPEEVKPTKSSGSGRIHCTSKGCE